MDFLTIDYVKNKLSLINFKFIYNYIKLILYNYFIGHYTQKLYNNFLKKIPNNSVVLDIGIGNCYSLIMNKSILIEKNIKIIGVDIDAESIKYAKQLINENNLNEFIKIHNANIYNFKSDKVDYIYFSNSFSVIPNVLDVINHTKDAFLKDDGQIVISTTIDAKYNYMRYIIKPNLKNIFFGIDFGRIVILENFVSLITDNNMSIKSMENVYNKWIFLWGDIDIYTTWINKVEKTNF